MRYGYNRNGVCVQLLTKLVTFHFHRLHSVCVKQNQIGLLYNHLHLSFSINHHQWRYSPDRALASLTGFMIVIVRCGVISSTIDLVLHTLIQPSETSGSNYQRLSWRSRETRVRNGRWILPTSTYRARRVILHAVNLRHGTDGFTSRPKEGVLRILSPLKSIVLGRV
jgi:hypothetical protein